MKEIYKSLLEDAKKISENTYSPYSNFAVGACVLYESGKKYCGVNIENASYGLTICAERVAISNAITQGEKSKIKAIAIYSPKQTKCAPCGACRQFINEFSSDDVDIILEDDNNGIIVLTLKEILPLGFKLL